jgi:hypothetical protein
VDLVVYIPSYFKPLVKEVTVEVPTGETKTTLFGTVKKVKRKQKQWRKTGDWSNCKIDGQRLAMDVEKAVRTLNSEGCEVVTIVPAISGAYNYHMKRDGWSGAGYGYGYSYTEGLIIVARKVT